jgi:hypothetical protein
MRLFFARSLCESEWDRNCSMLDKFPLDSNAAACKPAGPCCVRPSCISKLVGDRLVNC